jgi:hypothetical protein
MVTELEFINHTKLNLAGTSDVGLPMSDDTSRQLASGRTGVLGGSRLFHQLTDDRNRARPAPSLARLAWLERPDPDSAREDLARLVAASSPGPQALTSS